MVSETPEHVHQGCPTCTCDDRRERTIMYPPSLALYGSCGAADGCGEIRWQSETWTRTYGAWSPVRRLHCGCCPQGCPHHGREGEA